MLHHGDPHSNAKTILGFFIVVLLTGLFILLYQNQESFVDASRVNGLRVLVIIAGALLLTLYYFGTNSHHKPQRVTSFSSASKKKKKRTKK